MRKFMLYFILLAAVASFSACGNYWGHWGTNGTVYATLVHNNVLYLAGSFTQVRANVGGGAWLDGATGLLQPKKKVPYIDGALFTAVPDGSGGWYIGGAFTNVGGVTRNRIARINKDGSLNEDWNPDADGVVRAIVVTKTAVYAGGDFTQIGGESRNRIAALSPKTGLATAWDPNANSAVHCLAVAGNTVFAGGFFTNIGGENHDYLAAINLSTGNAITGWDPSPNDIVRAIAVTGTTVYVGGFFNGASSIGGQSRNYAAAIDADPASPTYGQATTWNPNPNGVVRVMAIVNETERKSVFLGGSFTTINSNGMPYIAKVALGGSATLDGGWNAVGAGGPVNTLTVMDTTVYAGGEFITMGVEYRNRAAALDYSYGTVLDWNPGAENIVNVIAAYNGSVYMGGLFTNCCQRDRNRIASVDLTTGVLADWNPDADDTVRALAAYGDTIYAGGDFANIGSQPRDYLAALDDVTGQASDWNPDPNDPVYCLAASRGLVYAGGDFTFMGADARNYIAAIDADPRSASYGTATAWDPDADGQVVSIALSPDTVYAGGAFATIGGESRSNIAALDPSTGDALAGWDPAPNGVVQTIALSGDWVYAGGAFTSIGGESLNRLAALDVVSGNADPAWNPSPNGQPRAVWPLKSVIYVGGDFTTIGTKARNRIAALDPATGAATGWDPDVESIVRTLSVSGDNIIAGGDFGYLNGGVYITTFLAGINAETGVLYGF